MNIQDILAKDTEKLTVWADFKSGISFQLRYVPRTDLLRISKESMSWEYDSKQRQRVQTVNRDAFSKRFCAKAVIGWKGVTPNALSEIIPVDLGSLTSEQREKEIEFSQENMLAIFTGAYEVDEFLQNSAVDASLFKPFHEEEKGNLPASQNGN